jgi:hypothetical protein
MFSIVFPPNIFHPHLVESMDAKPIDKKGLTVIHFFKGGGRFSSNDQCGRSYFSKKVSISI